MLSSDSRTDQCVSLRLGAGDANDLLVTQYWRGRSTFFQFLITSKILKGGGGLYFFGVVCVLGFGVVVG